MLSPPIPVQCPPLPQLIIASMSLLRGQPCQPQQLNHDIPWVTREEGMGPQGDFLGGELGTLSSIPVCPVQAQGEGQERWAGVLTEAREDVGLKLGSCGRDAQISPACASKPLTPERRLHLT